MVPSETSFRVYQSPPSCSQHVMSLKMTEKLIQALRWAKDEGIVPRIKFGKSPDNNMIEVGDKTFKFQSNSDTPHLCECFEAKLGGIQNESPNSRSLIQCGSISKKLAVQRPLDKIELDKWKNKSKAVEKTHKTQQLNFEDFCGKNNTTARKTAPEKKFSPFNFAPSKNNELSKDFLLPKSFGSTKRNIFLARKTNSDSKASKLASPASKKVFPSQKTVSSNKASTPHTPPSYMDNSKHKTNELKKTIVSQNEPKKSEDIEPKSQNLGFLNAKFFETAKKEAKVKESELTNPLRKDQIQNGGVQNEILGKNVSHIEQDLILLLKNNSNGMTLQEIFEFYRGKWSKNLIKKSIRKVSNKLEGNYVLNKYFSSLYANKEVQTSSLIVTSSSTLSSLVSSTISSSSSTFSSPVSSRSSTGFLSTTPISSAPSTQVSGANEPAYNHTIASKQDSASKLGFNVSRSTLLQISQPSEIDRNGKREQNENGSEVLKNFRVNVLIGEQKKSDEEMNEQRAINNGNTWERKSETWEENRGMGDRTNEEKRNQEKEKKNEEKCLNIDVCKNQENELKNSSATAGVGKKEGDESKKRKRGDDDIEIRENLLAEYNSKEEAIQERKEDEEGEHEKEEEEEDEEEAFEYHYFTKYESEKIIHFGEIKSDEELEKYKNEFHSKYDIYLRLYNDIQDAKKHFETLFHDSYITESKMDSNQIKKVIRMGLQFYSSVPKLQRMQHAFHFLHKQLMDLKWRLNEYWSTRKKYVKDN